MRESKWTQVYQDFDSIGALFMVTISIGAVASVIWAYVMYIAVLLTVGFDTSLYAEELAVIFYTVNGLLLAIFVGIGFSKLKDYRQQKQYEERQRIREQIRNGTYVEPVKSNSILREWLEALNDKICVEIDLTKYRTKSLKDAEESDY